MKLKYDWAATASLTVLASLLMAIHDSSYRPAFIQVATMALLTAGQQGNGR